MISSKCSDGLRAVQTPVILAPAVKTPALARNFLGNFIFKSGSRRKYFSVISEFIFFKHLFTTLLIVNNIVIYIVKQHINSNILVNNNLIFPFNTKCSLKYEIIFHNFVCRSFCRSFTDGFIRITFYPPRQN